MYTVWRAFSWLFTVRKDLLAQKQSQVYVRKMQGFWAWGSWIEDYETDLVDTWMGFCCFFWGSVKTPERRKSALAFAERTRHGLCSSSPSNLCASRHLKKHSFRRSSDEHHRIVSLPLHYMKCKTWTFISFKTYLVPIKLNKLKHFKQYFIDLLKWKL